LGNSITTPAAADARGEDERYQLVPPLPARAGVALEQQPMAFMIR
jgi:hypothetical protein